MTHHLPREWIISLEGHCLLYAASSPDSTDWDPGLLDLLPEAQGLFTLLTIPVTQSLLEKAPRLRVVSNMAVGVDNIDIQACTRRKIPVGHTPGVLTEATADLTMALLLSIARSLPQASLDAREGRWKTWAPAGWLGVELTGTKLGIIGMGKIGKAVARRAAGFGMHVKYCDPEPRPEVTAERVSMDDLLQTSDFVSLHAPLTQATRHLIDRAALARMKPAAILINAARGALVDTPALVAALQNHTIAAAALDVTDPEPLPVDHPLFSLPNCLVLPHIGSATQQTRRKMAELACENLLAGLERRQLPNCINPEVNFPDQKG